MLVAGSVVKEIQETWSGALALVERQLRAGAAVCEYAHSVASRFTHRERLALAFAGRAMHAFHSVELLFAAGHPQDATSAMRTLAELYIDYRWITHADEEARTRRFAEYIYVSGARREAARARVYGPPDPTALAEEFAKIDPGSLPPGVLSPQDLVRWHEEQYQRVEANYANRSSWAQIAIAQRATEIGERDLYDLVHRAGSEASHVTPSSMASLSRGEQTGRFYVEYQPLVPDDSFPLMMASQCFCLAFHYVIRTLAIATHDPVAALQTDLGPFTSGWQPDR